MHYISTLYFTFSYFTIYKVTLAPGIVHVGPWVRKLAEEGSIGYT